MTPAGPYVCEAHYPEHAGGIGHDAEGWTVVTDGGRDWCLGYLEAASERSPRRSMRVRHVKTGRVSRDVPGLDNARLGLVAGWPTVKQYAHAARRALTNIERGVHGDVGSDGQRCAATAAIALCDAIIADMPVEAEHIVQHRIFEVAFRRGVSTALDALVTAQADYRPPQLGETPAAALAMKAARDAVAALIGLSESEATYAATTGRRSGT